MLWNFKILEDTVTTSPANIAWNCYFTIQVVSYWLVAIYICIKMVSFGLMWSWKPNWGSLLPACLCNCSMDFTNHKGQNECDHPQQSIAHWFFSLYDSHKYWSSFFKQGGLLIYISQKNKSVAKHSILQRLFNVRYVNKMSKVSFLV